MQIFVQFAESKGEVFFNSKAEIYRLIVDVLKYSFLKKCTEKNLTRILDSFNSILLNCPVSSRKYIDDGLLSSILSMFIRNCSWFILFLFLSLEL